MDYFHEKAIPARIGLLDRGSDRICCNQPGKMFEGTIPGLLSFRGKTTSGKLSFLEVMFDALATDAVSWAPSVCARAFTAVFFFFAFHQ
jgi:hypothetical protein